MNHSGHISYQHAEFDGNRRTVSSVGIIAEIVEIVEIIVEIIAVDL